MPNRGRNLEDIDRTLEGPHVTALNALSPGLGDRFILLLSAIGNAHKATTGKKGTVVLKKQTKKDALGLVQNALEIEGRALGEDAIEDKNFVTLDQLRQATSCEAIIAKINECTGDDVEDSDGGDPVCLPTALSNPSPKATGLTNIYAVQATNEFVYVLGDEGGAIAILHVYRRGAANTIVRVGRLEMTQLCTRMILQGEYIFATRSNTGDLTVIDVRKPNAPAELSVSAQGGNGIHAQGRYVFCVQNGAIAIVDISNVGFPLQVGSAA